MRLYSDAFATKPDGKAGRQEDFGQENGTQQPQGQEILQIFLSSIFLSVSS